MSTPAPAAPSARLRDGWQLAFPEDVADYTAFAPFYSVLFSPNDADVEFWQQECAAAAKICEVGCGNGRLTESLALAAPERVVGIDPSRSMLASVPRPRHAEYREGSLTALDAHDSEFDLVICPRGAVSHVLAPHNLLRAAEELYRVTAPSGRVIIDVPRYSMSRSTHGKFKRLVTKRRHRERYAFSARVSMDLTWNYLESTYRVRVTKRGRQVAQHELTLRTRIMTLPELLALLSAAGYAVTRAYGGFDRQSLGPESGRIIVEARRPG